MCDIQDEGVRFIGWHLRLLKGKSQITVYTDILITINVQINAM